ncbi:HNH endonuclease [Luteibacter sp. OK325]|uniref:HNH endonuclease n=1 Tax=Luteibacter sp. OK325 TaxID=2135670 RepID=UPI0021009578|nr:HNH endonuclease [Luteibacter sp. OK325]
MGPYCSFCERKMPTSLAVEHIQAKGLAQYANLIGTWENFLLACVNCNSTKGTKDVVLNALFLPDRDNTFHALAYHADGSITASAHAQAAGFEPMVDATLALTGLDKAAVNTADHQGVLIALDRILQRAEAWAAADIARANVAANPDSDAMRSMVVQLATATGFFSVWLTIFSGDSDMVLRLIRAFPGTEASGCFEALIGTSRTPSPNLDALPFGAKI